MQDYFIDIDDAVFLSRPPEFAVVEAQPTGEHWSEKFRNMDKYDWNDPKWLAQNKGKYAFLPIPLTQDYFMIVSPKDYKRMTTYPDGRPKKWYASVKRDKEGNLVGLYGGRSGRGDEPAYVGAHRELLHCLDAKGPVDHVNQWGLDNRAGTSRCPVNLILESVAVNMYNAVRYRWVHIGLLRGVEKRGVNKEGKQRYGGVRARRLGKNKVKTYRSKRTWLKEWFAHRWYLNQIKRLSGGRTSWAHRPETVHFPKFPPPMDSEPARPRRTRRNKVLEDIPFD